ncbi:ArsR/SmtB family transcription factor [Actinomycetospora chibensis]|uniref:ArsR/SmtB family transcription factor n=1 Tax=Actinomycetospora chibensis TaxID=663606 RepID=A0ABV9RE35_9PSEU|nr:metalloregulator ArsR/SmtB family transcription factor [Actinomycetospora chibensis]MDD7923997.1 metalloregulator ArsR/SmtB family transcription factor [Actinomycetospora chibensis]
MDEVFRALADPSRRALLDALHARGGQSLRELGEGLDMSRQAVAKHLGVLEAAGLVVTSWQGREKHHHLNAAPINDVADRWIRRYDRARAQTLADLKQALQENSEETEMSDDFVYVTYIRTTPEKLWQALTDPAFIAKYYDGGGPTSDWAVGSKVLWSMGGEDPHDWDQHVLEADPPRRLSFTWHNYQPEMQEMFGWSDERLAELQQEKRSKVTFDIEPAGKAVKLTVTHDDFVPDSEMLKGVSGGWPAILSNLKSVLETGEAVVTD